MTGRPENVATERDRSDGDLKMQMYRSKSINYRFLFSIIVIHKFVSICFWPPLTGPAGPRRVVILWIQLEVCIDLFCRQILYRQVLVFPRIFRFSYTEADGASVPVSCVFDKSVFPLLVPADRNKFLFLPRNWNVYQRLQNFVFLERRLNIYCRWRIGCSLYERFGSWNIAEGFSSHGCSDISCYLKELSPQIKDCLLAIGGTDSAKQLDIDANSCSIPFLDLSHFDARPIKFSLGHISQLPVTAPMDDRETKQSDWWSYHRWKDSRSALPSRRLQGRKSQGRIGFRSICDIIAWLGVDQW